MQTIKIKGHTGLVKDKKTGAILNQDRSKLDDYLARRQIFIDKANNEKKINTLENELSEIKELLKSLVKV